MHTHAQSSCTGLLWFNTLCSTHPTLLFSSLKNFTTTLNYHFSYHSRRSARVRSVFFNPDRRAHCFKVGGCENSSIFSDWWSQKFPIRNSIQPKYEHFVAYYRYISFQILLTLCTVRFKYYLHFVQCGTKARVRGRI